MNMQILLQSNLFLQVITSGRLESIIAGIVGLVSLVVGRIALSRVTRDRRSGRIMAIIAVMIGLVSVILSVLRLVRATGGFGTGSGRLGAIVALVIAAIGILFGGLALVRSKRIARRKMEHG